MIAKDSGRLLPGSNKVTLSLFQYLFCIFLLFFLVIPRPAFCEDEKIFEMEPGWRCGLIIFTMSLQEVQQIYGEGEVFIVPDPHGGPKMTMLSYKNMGVDILFKGNRIEEINVSYPIFSVKNMLKVGSGVDRVKEVMGDNFLVENYQHNFQPDLPEYKMIYRGITFHVKNERVVKITLTSRGRR